MPMPPQSTGMHWEEPGPRATSISLHFIEHFDARGMRRLYGRGDQLGRQLFQMDVWINRESRLFARLWSRSSDVDTLSLEIRGHPAALEDADGARAFSEAWVPEGLRAEYYDWILSYLRAG
jgi:hypothetical protein